MSNKYEPSDSFDSNAVKVEPDEHVLTRIRKRAQKLPDEIWESIPSDASERLDEYLYIRKESEMKTFRTVNRIPENTTITVDNSMIYLDQKIEVSNNSKIYHNGQKLEKGTHYEFIRNKEVGKDSLGLKLKVQLQPNDRLQIE